VSVKFQVTLPEPLLTGLKRVAEAEKVSVAELIRQTMLDRLKTRNRRPTEDPFDAITDLVESEQVDLASQIDDILYR
jgi:metal-responsive CopG/Arc/MetJ family transcriptional regulator